MRTLLGLMLCSSSVVFFACSGHTIDVGSGSQGELAPEAGSPEAAIPEAAPPSATSFTAAQVAAAKAACNAPHGSVDAYSTVEGLVQRATGAWYKCTPDDDSGLGSIGFTADSSAVFGADGQWHRLVPDGSGGLRMSQGLQDSGAYSAAPVDDASAECDPSNCLVTYAGDDGQIEQFNLSFESGPRRMLLGEQVWFVPLQ